MKKISLKEIIDKLPPDFSRHTVKDISVLGNSIFGESHPSSMHKMFGGNFSVTLWVAKPNNHVVFYRSAVEYDDYAKKCGEYFNHGLTQTKKITQKLRQYTDWFENFFQVHQALHDLVKHREKFFDAYRDFFAVHQAVYWAGDYLHHHLPGRAKTKKIISILSAAYKYNELVVPHAEKYFKKLHIGHLVYDEIKNAVYKNIKHKQKNRSLLFIGKKRYILTHASAKKIEQNITDRAKQNLLGLRMIKGLGVSRGQFTGIVKAVTTHAQRLLKCGPQDVLVMPMTRPRYNEFIKKVGAIVTDEGGILCHAALLAREFEIPCIVGTKIATQVLKDGDMVEVDADRGVVRKIK
ncbi:hypothetical protein COT27_01555 [Candidatus Kuenenbacteria bacterium CG08_land_8_20_14_0_20_37_23]|uniref:PEP-utilising enzyme mobile domain-containing protein n=1 Tax=Candidatus Kuenenbacteria bacterium CG08_land_8_20_14_0_20_37_23 TaxID=1974617 RepID=A0A2M6XT54_9BACT|nr:MAG: hypothetical protein COT27_01555 [Candidatus Kuenenbacteria bacterium CG08_land_8_20_14_0_20_37_23]